MGRKTIWKEREWQNEIKKRAINWSKERGDKNQKDPLYTEPKGIGDDCENSKDDEKESSKEIKREVLEKIIIIIFWEESKIEQKLNKIFEKILGARRGSWWNDERWL